MNLQSIYLYVLKYLQLLIYIKNYKMNTIPNEMEDEFRSFLCKIFTDFGLDNVTCKLFSMLYLELEPVAIDELSSVTGYSLATISNKMRLLEGIGFAQRVKAPKSKKVFYFVEKNFISLMNKKLDKMKEIEIRPAKEIIPAIINKFKNKKFSEKMKLKYEIIQNYYKQILEIEKIIDEMKLKLNKVGSRN
jgi:HTH-type transcriptional regulator, osmoprotectant uptake regulator